MRKSRSCFAFIYGHPKMVYLPDSPVRMLIVLRWWQPPRSISSTSQTRRGRSPGPTCSPSPVLQTRFASMESYGFCAHAAGEQDRFSTVYSAICRGALSSPLEARQRVSELRRRRFGRRRDVNVRRPRSGIGDVFVVTVGARSQQYDDGYEDNNDESCCRLR